MLKVKILAHTPSPNDVIAMAGKLCYSSVGIEDLGEKLTPAKSEKFVNKLMGMEHESPLEHVTFTFGIEGISRSCSHQIVRHRIASYSQQSQRYVKLEQFEYIVPPAIEDDEELKELYIKHMMDSQEVYDNLVEGLIESHAIKMYKNKYEYALELWGCGAMYMKFKTAMDVFEKYNGKEYSQIEKQAIEDARYVFPNACETKMIVTMNVRSLHHFFEERCCERAQWEIRELATEMLRQCKEVSPILFANCGPKCVKGKCTEGNMSCGLSKEKIKLFLGEEQKCWL